MKKEEKELYIAKSGNIAETIRGILERESGDVFTDNLRAELKKIQLEAQTVHDKLKNDEFEIAIVGLEKAGKSSFSNALIEKNLLPTDDQRCTYTATCIRYNERDSATITFYDENRFEKDFKEKLEKLGIKNAESYSYHALTLEKYEDLYDNRSENGNKYDETLNEDIRNILNYKGEISRYLGKSPRNYREDELKQEEFQGFIKDPRKAIAVEEVVIHSKVLSGMRNAVIYDVPGFNSPTELHKIQTLDKMRSADAIIMVAKGDEPSLTGDVLKIFRQSDDDGTELKDKLFVFANKSDRATDFQKNKEITYEQWIEKYKYIKEKERIVFGSANAYLQECGELEGNDYVRAVREKKLPWGDGIVQIKEILKSYNETQRFEVLKRRINKLSENLKDKLKGEGSEFGKTENDGQENGKLAMKLLSEARSNIPKMLENYNEEIKTHMRSKPLSQDIHEKIDCVVSVERFQITETEIEEMHKKHAGVDKAEQTGRVENDIRESRFHKMYDIFSKEVVDMTLEKHKKCEEEIIDRCLDAIGMKRNTETSLTVKKKLKALFEDAGIIGQGEGNYYQSLVERYSQDIYEILIYAPYTAERIGKFYENQNNFYSLAVFYKENEDDPDIANSNERIKDLPMCRKLLFHMKKEEQNTKRAYEKVKELFAENSKELLELVIRLGKVAPSKVLNIVSEICSELCEDQDMDERARATEAKMQLDMRLRQQENDTSIYSADITEENFKEQYGRFHGERTINYDSIRQDFSEDVETLHNILQNAFVNAIAVEKPFVAREKKIIDDIKALITDSADDTFINFLSDNMWLIKSEECSRIKEKEGKSRMIKAFYQEISELVAQIDQVS